jgi:hypothetical protein
MHIATQPFQEVNVTQSLVAREPAQLLKLSAWSFMRLGIIALLGLMILFGLVDGWFLSDTQPDTTFIGGTIR